MMRMNRREKVNILVVDDEPRNVLALEAVLDGLGEHVVCARSGQQALRELLNRDFALVLLDVRMPGMDGFETAKLIRERERSQHMPIIFLTAINKATEHIRMGYLLGCVDYVFKPYEPEILRSKVSVFVELYRHREHVKVQAEQLRAAEERQRSAELLQELQRQHEVILQAVGEGICGFDQAGRIQFVNAAATSLLRRAERDLVGRCGHEVLHGGLVECPGDACGLAQAIAGSPSQTFDDEQFVRGDGGAIVVECTTTHVHESSGLATVLVFKDISQRRRVEEERTQLLGELAGAVRARDDFLSIASHELRSPLTPIRLELQTLLRKTKQPAALPPERLTLVLGKLNQQVGRLVKLLDELLDVSRITVGKLSLEREPFELTTLVGEVVDRHRSQLKLAGYKLNVRASELISGNWDRLRIELVLNNLLSNAIKYGGGGSSIDVDVYPDEAGARISVRDHGIGISVEDQRRIFDRFERAVSVRHVGGFGLGLWIVRQIVEAHGGSIDVASPPGQGSVFTVHLPLDSTSAPVRDPARN
jgi:PAS domain S-box-containing protein